jgi:hypothetical protein
VVNLMRETRQFMSSVRRSAWTPIAWALILGANLVVAGCGGETPATKPEAQPQATANPAPPPAKTVKRSGKGQVLAEGGDQTAQERRAARLKSKKSAE